MVKAMNIDSWELIDMPTSLESSPSTSINHTLLFMILIFFAGLGMHLVNMISNTSNEVVMMLNNMPSPNISLAMLDRNDDKSLDDFDRFEIVTVTAYTNHPSETWGDPNITASGSKVRPGIIAVSRDLLQDGWSFGTRVHVKDIGDFVVKDTMSSRFKNRIDIFMYDRSKALNFGKKSNVLMGRYKIEEEL